MNDDDDMKLPEGKTCADCYWFKKKCSWLIGFQGHETECDWAPSKFIELPQAIKATEQPSEAVAEEEVYGNDCPNGQC